MYIIIQTIHMTTSLTIEKTLKGCITNQAARRCLRFSALVAASLRKNMRVRGLRWLTMNDFRKLRIHRLKKLA